MDGGAWWAAVHGVVKSQTQLSDFTFTFHFHALEKEMATHSSVLAWRIPGMVEPGGLPSTGSHRVKHDRSDLAAAAAARGFPSDSVVKNPPVDTGAADLISGWGRFPGDPYVRIHREVKQLAQEPTTNQYNGGRMQIKQINRVPSRKALFLLNSKTLNRRGKEK